MDYERAIKLLRDSERILLTSHVRPDGDAVGSVGALRALLEQAARKEGRRCSVRTLFLGEVPENYGFVLAETVWVLGRDVQAEELGGAWLEQFALAVVVDTHAARQLPVIGEALAGWSRPVLVIDHHPAGGTLGDVRLIETEAGAAGVLVYELADRAGWPITTAVAEALFVAISSDTGWFRFSNCGRRVFGIAGRLIEAGADPSVLYRRLYENFPAARLKLVALALGTIELFAGGRAALMHVSKAMLAQSGAQRSHIENIVNQSQQIGSVEVSVLLVEEEDGTVRASFRSRGSTDVNVLAQGFGGGGHSKAAGASLEAGLEAARATVRTAVEAALGRSQESEEKKLNSEGEG